MSELSKAKEKFTTSEYLKFIIPSIIAFLIFLGPITSDGQVTTFLSWLLDSVKSAIGSENRVPVAFVICSIGAILTILSYFIKGKISFLEKNVKTKPLWAICRILGALFLGMTLLQIGPEFIISSNTGGLMGSMSVSVSLAVLIGGLILPFLTNFGALQFIGIFMQKIMYTLFKVPGMSCIDCLVSWVGSSGLGMYYTAKMHKSGQYTDKEAAIIITNFSLVSMPFLYVMAEMVNLGHMAYQFILTSYIICIIIAMITPRIYPLNRYKNTDLNGKEIVRSESPASKDMFSAAVAAGVNRAKTGTISGSLKEGVVDGLSMAVSVVPVVMALGTIALAIFEYTSILQTLAYPFGWLIQLAGIPEPFETATSITVGVVDQLLAPVIGGTLESEISRFFTAVIGTTGVLYIAQPIPIILGSSVPLRVRDIFIIYFERVILTIVLIVPFIHIFF